MNSHRTQLELDACLRYSIVIPFHNEEANITPMYERLTNVMEAITDEYELILVDDGSTDRTQVLIRGVAASR